MTDLILHHYDSSPFSEKIRLVLGWKGLAWRSVHQPNMLPKPDLVPLTGGYRRIPVLQRGADVYCDSQLIARVIEHEHPERTIFPSGTAGLCHSLGFWADRILFPQTVPVVFEVLGAGVPKAFLEDRRALLGGADFGALVATAPLAKLQLRGQLAFLETQLADGRRYLLGDQPSLADFAAYHPVWFLRSIPPAAETLLEFEGLCAWADRIGGIGHGAPEACAPADALAIARDSKPAPPFVSGGSRPDPDLRERVRITPDDYGFEPVEGELVVSTRDEIAVRRVDEAVGEIVVHFPRAGFRVARG